MTTIYPLSAIVNQYVQSNLELAPGWSEKVGAAYNKIQSTIFQTTLLANGLREFYHEAPAGGGWLSGLNDLPIPAGFSKGICIHSHTLMFDGSVLAWPTGSRIAAELDNRIADGLGNNFNSSNQINLSNNWEWQVDAQGGKWVGTGVHLTPLAPFVWHDIAFETGIDIIGLKIGFNAIIVNGIRYPAPPQFLNLTPMKDAVGHFWKRGANRQVQMCRQTAGRSSMWAKNINQIWIPAA